MFSKADFRSFIKVTVALTKSAAGSVTARPACRWDYSVGPSQATGFRWVKHLFVGKFWFPRGQEQGAQKKKKKVMNNHNSYFQWEDKNCQEWSVGVYVCVWGGGEGCVVVLWIRLWQVSLARNPHGVVAHPHILVNTGRHRKSQSSGQTNKELMIWHIKRGDHFGKQTKQNKKGLITWAEK